MATIKAECVLPGVTLGLSCVALLYILAWYVVAVRSSLLSTTADGAMLLVHVAVPVCAAVLVCIVYRARGEGSWSGLFVARFVVFLIFLAIAVMHAKSLRTLGMSSDYSPLPESATAVPAPFAWLLKGHGVIVLGCVGLLVIGWTAVFAYATPLHLRPMTNPQRIAISLIVLIALTTLWFMTERMVTRIDWRFFGTIDAFGWMVMNYLALPLMVVVFGLMIATADETTTKAVIVFCVTGFCVTLLASLAAAEFVHDGGLRAPYQVGFTVPLLGISRVLSSALVVRGVMAALTVVAALVLVNANVHRSTMQERH